MGEGNKPRPKIQAKAKIFKTWIKARVLKFKRKSEGDDARENKNFEEKIEDERGGEGAKGTVLKEPRPRNRSANKSSQD